MFEILAWLLVKHFICDFPLQSHPFLHAYKGNYGGAGGICHALIQGAGTLLVLALIPGIGIETALTYAALDTVIHYHIDWAKTSLNSKMNWGPTTNDKFWILLGFDQFLHHMTYVLIAYLVISP
ncbi:MAG: DUF3307 domain-containing protein [Rhodospirillales bacterium]|nr:DUF3307 domain-containing protein [Rhodospirillales bacterium]